MGVLDKIISYVTGNSAKIDLFIPQASLNSPFRASIKAFINDHDIEADYVYLNIQCMEAKKAYIPPKEGKLTDNEKMLSELNEWNTKILFKKKIEVARHLLLKKGLEYSWDTTIDLSGAEKASTHGETCKIIWKFQAAINMFGINPDSGWKTIEVS